MNIGSSPSVTASVNQTSPQNAASVSVLKKALDIQAQGAISLINAIPESPQPGSGSLGSNLNVVA